MLSLDIGRRKALLQVGGAAALAMIAGPSYGQALPKGTIKLYVGFPPGGGTDIMGRYIADKLHARLGNNVVVENRAGASGTIAIEAMKQAPTDGSVLFFAPSATTVAQVVTRKLPTFDPNKDLTAISLTGTVAVVFVVSSTIGVNTLPEYIEWLKKNPSKATFGTTAMGSATHFSGVALGQALGIPLLPVAYKGAGPLVGDLLAGHVPAGCGGLTDFLTHHQAGKVKIIATTASKRAAAAPELPTIGELGYPKLTYEGFYGFYGPGKMSAELVNAWNRELRAAVESADLKQRLVSVGLEVLTSTPAEMSKRQNDEMVSFSQSMKAAGYEPD
jgi:tripartite-type tricarboxylate transporter receptor subunit TctC